MLTHSHTGTHSHTDTDTDTDRHLHAHARTHSHTDTGTGCRTQSPVRSASIQRGNAQDPVSAWWGRGCAGLTVRSAELLSMVFWSGCGRATRVVAALGFGHGFSVDLSVANLCIVANFFHEKQTTFARMLGARTHRR